MVRKTWYAKQGELSEAEAAFILPNGERRAGRAAVRASIVARKARNGVGAKGCRKVDVES